MNDPIDEVFPPVERDHRALAHFHFAEPTIECARLLVPHEDSVVAADAIAAVGA